MKHRGRPPKVKIEHAIGDEVLMNSLAVAELLGCSDRTALELMRTGAIESKQAGSVWFTTRSAILRYIKPPEESK